MTTTTNMSPDDSPGVAPKKNGVRRVNNLPMYIVGAVLGTFLVIMALVAIDRAEQQAKQGKQEAAKVTNTSMFADELVNKAGDGLVPAVNPTPPTMPAPDLSTLPPSADALTAPPAPPPPPSTGTDTNASDDKARIKQMKLAQFEAAIKATTAVQASAPRSAGSAPDLAANSGSIAGRSETMTKIAALQQQIDMQLRDDPAAAYKARLQQLRDGPGGGGPQAQTDDASSPQKANGGKDYAQFGNATKQDRWQLDSQLQSPRSPYELRAGFIIPAILISGINSDLPGQIIGQVSQDVYDTATGKWKLVPQGSRLIGEYSSDVAYGQARVLIAWQRIIFPDGKALDIGAMPGADSAGYAGFNDRVNNHYFRLFGSALLMSGVTAGIALSQRDELYSSRLNARSAMTEALGQHLGQATAQMITRNMGIAPTLEIRPGYRFNVVVIKDLTFSKPYKPFDY
ncbi:MAG: TrbI/VirB10 family protein [Burkholderiaceae bacterium]|nr:TrbI/VirB10 family protein [Burkholderiaceae bacterium]